MMIRRVLSREVDMKVIVSIAGDDPPVMRAAGHGDMFRVARIVFTYVCELTRTIPRPGALTFPITVAGLPVSATHDGPPTRGTTFRNAAETPPWLLALAERVRDEPVSTTEPVDPPREVPAERVE
jgi:hypothetical protein